MNIKSLSIRYIFYYFICIILVLGLINIFKKKELSTYLDYYKNNINIKYSEYYKDYENTSEFIYYNEFIKDDKFIKILKNNSQEELKYFKNTLYKYFINTYTFYKTLDIYNITFYSINAEQILNMEDFPADELSTLMVKEIIKNKKDLQRFRMIDEKIFLIFSKPIFDEKLNLISIINIEYDFDSLLAKLSKNNDFNYKSFLSNHLSENEKKILNMKNVEKAMLNNNISKGEEFAVILKQDYIEYPVIFLPVFSSSFYNNHLYILASNTDKHNYISKVSKHMFFLFFIASIILALILFLIYKLKQIKIERFNIRKNRDYVDAQMNEYIKMIDLDLDKNIIFATKPFIKLSGYSKDEIIGKNLMALKQNDISELFFETIWEDLNKNKSWKGEIKCKDKIGNSFWIKTTIFPKYDSDDKIIAYGLIITNITDTKQLEKINKLLKDDLSNKLNEIKIKDKTLVDTTKVKLMSKILDSLSNQWKKPVSNISSDIQVLKSNFNKTDINKYEIFKAYENIELQLKNLSTMLNELKYLFDSKENEKSNLSKVLNESINENKDELQSNKIKIKQNINEDISIEISNNELKNILSNIIKNELEQTKLNKLNNVKIFISVIEEKNDVIIKIEDNIKGNFKNMINEVFSSSLADDSKKYSNNFLYLAILLIEKNKGLFWCDNQEYNTIYYIKLNSEFIKS